MNYSFDNFQKNAIIRFLALDKYNYIKDNLYKCDVSKDSEFQTRFNAFYRVRRDDKWRKIFYNYFEEIKNNKNITFDEILDYMYKKTGSIEASFCSKMLSTINPNMPIWDQFVLNYYNIEVEGNNPKDRIKDIIKKYYEIVKKEKEELQKEEIKEAIKQFKEDFKEYNISDIKILDFMIWSRRD